MTPRPHDDPAAKPIVLVIDDAKDVQRLLIAKLRHENMHLVSAHNGREGLAMARELRPSAILLDLDMPDMDGLTVIRRLKADESTQDIAVIVVSSHSRPEHKTAAFELGAVDYVTKPFEFAELRVRLRAALRMRHLVQLLAQRAQVDGLTGLWNRAFFDHRWEQEHSRSARHGHALSIAMIDIDHFKAINDRLGHAAGDVVLQGVARIMQEQARRTDLVCRYGGEEFVLILPDTGTQDATVLCERIRAAVASATWPETGLVCTISVGIAGASGATPHTSQHWVQIADRNLYASKQSGRNRVVSSDLLRLDDRTSAA